MPTTPVSSSSRLPLISPSQSLLIECIYRALKACPIPSVDLLPPALRYEILLAPLWMNWTIVIFNTTLCRFPAQSLQSTMLPYKFPDNFPLPSSCSLRFTFYVFSLIPHSSFCILPSSFSLLSPHRSLLLTFYVLRFTNTCSLLSSPYVLLFTFFCFLHFVFSLIHHSSFIIHPFPPVPLQPPPNSTQTCPAYFAGSEFGGSRRIP